MRLAVLFNLVFVLLMLSLGTWCVNYDLGYAHKHIPLFWAFVVNLFTGNLPVAIAIVLKILSICGVL